LKIEKRFTNTNQLSSEGANFRKPIQSFEFIIIPSVSLIIPLFESLATSVYHGQHFYFVSSFAGLLFSSFYCCRFCVASHYIGLFFRRRPALQARTMVMSFVPSIRVATTKSSIIASNAHGVLPSFCKGFATTADPLNNTKSTGSNKTSVVEARQPGIVASVQSIESQLQEVVKAIKSVEEEIKETSKAIVSATDATMRAFLMCKETQLREEKKQLRDEEKQLISQKSDESKLAATSTLALICLRFDCFFDTRAHQYLILVFCHELRTSVFVHRFDQIHARGADG
jgi:hypothetical protein